MKFEIYSRIVSPTAVSRYNLDIKHLMSLSSRKCLISHMTVVSYKSEIDQYVSVKCTSMLACIASGYFFTGEPHLSEG